MRKKKWNKNRAKRMAATTKRVKPDDYLTYGPLQMARFGKTVVFQNHMSKEQFEEVQSKLVERFPAVCRDIDAKIAKIVEIVKNLSPQELLKRAYWEMYTAPL